MAIEEDEVLVAVGFGPVLAEVEEGDGDESECGDFDEDFRVAYAFHPLSRRPKKSKSNCLLQIGVWALHEMQEEVEEEAVCFSAY